MFLFATSVALQNLVRAVVSSSVYMCLQDVYKTWTGVHGPPHGPGPWTTMDHPMDLVHGPGPMDHP